MDPLDFTDTSEERYNIRLHRFRRDGNPHPTLRHTALWLLHNCVAHPILAFAPGQMSAEFHELTSQWLQHSAAVFGTRTLYVRKRPQITPEKRVKWVLHNVVAHIAIGVAPCKATFRFHDKTAEAMQVDGWV